MLFMAIMTETENEKRVDHLYLGTWKIPIHHLTSILRPPLIDSHSQNPQNSPTILAVLLNQLDQIWPQSESDLGILVFPKSLTPHTSGDLNFSPPNTRACFLNSSSSFWWFILSVSFWEQIPKPNASSTILLCIRGLNRHHDPSRFPSSHRNFS